LKYKALNTKEGFTLSKAPGLVTGFFYENIQKLVTATREVLTVELDDVVAG
jgi:hypothetical protein